MIDWYRPGDVAVGREYLIPESSTAEDTIAVIAATSGLLQDGLTRDFLPRATGRP